MRGVIRTNSAGTTTYFVDGKPVTKRAFRRAFPPQPLVGEVLGGKPVAGWPLYSDAAGCHPKQVKELEKLAAERGVPTEVTPDGQVVFRDRAHRKAYLKAFNMYDNDGCFGD